MIFLMNQNFEKFKVKNFRIMIKQHFPINPSMESFEKSINLFPLSISNKTSY